MREILFRGKTIDTNDWAFGSLVYSLSENQYYIIEHSGDELSFPIHAESRGQYTGLTDTNGKKIFEGDIAKTDYGDIGVVSWNKQYCCFDFVKQGAKIDEGELLIVVGALEVVGNTYDIRTMEAQNGTN